MLKEGEENNYEAKLFLQINFLPDEIMMEIFLLMSIKEICAQVSKVKLTTCFHEFSEHESTNFFYQILCNICFDFLTCSKLSPKRKRTFILPFIFQLRNIGKKIRRFGIRKIRENMS